MVNHKRSLSFLMFVIMFMIANCGLYTQNIVAKNDSIENRLFKRVVYAAEKGQILKAKDNVKRVLKLNPRHQGALFYAGVILFKKNKITSAKKFFLEVSDTSRYGEQARAYLSEIKLSKIRIRFSDDLQKKLSGEAYRDALKMCEEGLASSANNKNILFQATFAATMAGFKTRADGFLARYLKVASQDAASAELKSFVEAWFKVGYRPEYALDKLFVLTDKRLLSAQVKKKIMNLVISMKQLDKFEELIEREKKVPGANVSALERKLISFYIDMGMHDKALTMINNRPANSIEDNILYMKLLISTSREKKAMLVARRLLGSSKDDLRLYKIWAASYLCFYKRTEKVPDGFDEGGMKYSEMAAQIFSRVRFNRLVENNSFFLLDLLRLAVVTEDSKNGLKIVSQVVNISYSKQHIPKLLMVVDELVASNKNIFAVQILESALNQLPSNVKIQVKLAELYYMTDKINEAVSLLNTVLEQYPENIRAFMTWVDCLTVLGKSDVAELELLKRLDNPNLVNIVKRRLDAKLASIRMKGASADSSVETE